MFVNGSNHPYGCIQQCQSEGHWNNTPQTPNLTSYMARMGVRSRFFWAHQCERGGTARCVGGVHMFVNGSNHPYGCIQQCQSEGHWNNTPQTPNLTSYMARMGVRSRFSGRINVNVVAQRGVLEVYICS